jgi:hypothetical protein
VLVGIGCAGDGATPTYEGARRAPAEVATLRPAAYIEILTFDARPYSAQELEILPGPHRVVFEVTFRAAELGGAFANAEMRNTCQANAKFIAEAGVSYRLEKLSKRRKRRFAVVGDAIVSDHQFGVLLIDEHLDEAIPDAVSQMNCG